MVGLDDECVLTCIVLRLVPFDSDREVGVTAHEGIGMVDSDIVRMSTGEGNADCERGQYVLGMNVEPFLVSVDGT